MNVSFLPLVTLTVSHGYYSGLCEHLELLPSLGTRESLRRGRSLMRSQPGSLQLAFEADAAGDALSSLAGPPVQTLYFGLRPLSAQFANVSAPPVAGRGQVPLYANFSTPTAFDSPIPVRIVSLQPRVEPSLPQRPVDISWQHESGATGFARSKDGPPLLDLRATGPGLYRLTEQYAGGTLRKQDLLADAELAAADVWGACAVRIGATFYAAASSGGIALSLPIGARSEPLSYYVIAPSWTAAEFNQLIVEDAGFTQQARPQVVFTRVDPPFPAGFLDVAALAAGSPRVAAFRSPALPRRDRGLRGLRLRRGTNVLVENLPLPSPRRPSADLIVRLSKP